MGIVFLLLYTPGYILYLFSYLFLNLTVCLFFFVICAFSNFRFTSLRDSLLLCGMSVQPYRGFHALLQPWIESTGRSSHATHASIDWLFHAFHQSFLSCRQTSEQPAGVHVAVYVRGSFSVGMFLRCSQPSIHLREPLGIFSFTHSATWRGY